MSAAEIKETKSNLIAWINQLSDANMLSMLDGLRTLGVDDYSWDNLTEFQKKHIAEGLDDIEHGRVISSEELWSRLKDE
jgi:hypothetical protein